ncbi:TPA: hypothetical protein ACGQ3O_002172 [Streptococcus agalactiae]
MTYELCLEYGTYPLRPVDAWADEINTAPAFITEDKKLLELLEEVNTLFHELHAVRMKTFSSSFCARTSILKRFLFKSMICLASFSK